MISQEQIMALGPAAHLRMYGAQYRAYLINKLSGAKDAMLTNQRGMHALQSLGTFSTREAQRLQRTIRPQVLLVRAFINGTIIGEQAARQAA
jgi:hypothetical protein